MFNFFAKKEPIEIKKIKELIVELSSITEDEIKKFEFEFDDNVLKIICPTKGMIGRVVGKGGKYIEMYKLFFDDETFIVVSSKDE